MPVRYAQRSGFLVVLVAVATLSSSAQQLSPRPAVPIEPIRAILDAFRTHAIVALSDAHGNAQAQAFLISLVRDSVFAATVNDIVVEFGSARYQDVSDRFVRGEDVPYESLRHVWQDTTQPSPANDLPINEEFFRAVRAVNTKLPRERQLRVLLGDPPIDWDRVKSPADHRRWIEMRETYPAALIQLEVLAKDRRALLVYGHGHFQRKNVASNFEMTDWRTQTIVSLLESAGPTKVFAIWRASNVAAIQPDAASWPGPSLALIRGTVIGAADASRFHDWPARFTIRDGKPVAIPKSEYRLLPAEEQFDAVLYLGPSQTNTDSQLAPALCADADYMMMRINRMALVGLPPSEANRLKEYCAGLTTKK